MEAFLPYFAGFFDGEGSIGVYRNGNTNGRTVRVQVTQNVTEESTRLLLDAHTRWGGCLTLMNRQAKRDAWMWQVSSSLAVATLVDIRPWLRLKTTQADLVLEWWPKRPARRRGPNGRFQPFTPQEDALDREIELKLKAAKRADEMQSSVPPELGISATPLGASPPDGEGQN